MAKTKRNNVNSNTRLLFLRIFKANLDYSSDQTISHFIQHTRIVYGSFGIL